MPAPSNPKDLLKVIIDSNTPMVLIETAEELRALAVIREAASELNMPVFEWSVADGLQRANGTGPIQVPPIPVVLGKEQYRDENIPQPIYNTREADEMLAHLQTLTVEAVFVLKDLHRHLDSAVVVRRLRQVGQEFERDRRTVVITAPSLTLPPELQTQVQRIDLPLPDKSRLRKLIDEEFSRLSQKRKLHSKISVSELDAAAANLCGLTEQEAERAVSQAIISRYALLPEFVQDVLEAKRDILRQSGTLDFIPSTQPMSDVAGLENLKTWLRKRRNACTPEAVAVGLEPPKGVVILGVQGCGKSLSARCIAGEWHIPLVKFDVAAIFDKYIGETEKRLQQMFCISEQLAPCVLWIDELEKVFAGSSPDSASSDAGTSARLLGAFLSWMQDRRSPVFVAATCNNVEQLPPELIRKGRFDEIFFVDLPTGAERTSIFELHLKKRKLDPTAFDLKTLVTASIGYSGAEIEAAVQSAQYAAFAEKQPVTTERISTEIKSTVPLSRARAEDVERLRTWARERAVPASASEVAAVGASKG
jgi:SpoVK/Ycf46/Vps4 family AAA+-type ATPase